MECQCVRPSRHPPSSNSATHGSALTQFSSHLAPGSCKKETVSDREIVLSVGLSMLPPTFPTQTEWARGARGRRSSPDASHLFPTAGVEMGLPRRASPKFVETLERQKDRASQTETCQLLVHSLQNAHNTWSWARLKSGARNSNVGLPHG